jgi:glutathione S-transferase
MKLYYSPGSCALSSHIVLREAGLDFEPIKVSLDHHQLDDGSDYYAINPLGYVPVLELDDGSRLREGPAIVQYLADQVPSKNLAPTNGTLARYRLQEWLGFIGTEIHSVFVPLFSPATHESSMEAARSKLLSRFEWVDTQLADRNYLSGEHFSVADAHLFAINNWADLVGVDLNHLAHLQAWRQRVAARPAVQEALRHEEA